MMTTLRCYKTMQNLNGLNKMYKYLKEIKIRLAIDMNKLTDNILYL